MFFYIPQLAAAAAKSLQLCPTLCDPIDGSPPGSTVPGIHQARTLEWVAISFSNAWKWKMRVKSLSHVQLFATPWTSAYQAPPSMGFSRQEDWSGVPLPSPQLATLPQKSPLRKLPFRVMPNTIHMATRKLLTRYTVLTQQGPKKSKESLTTRVGFEPTRAEHNGLAVHHLNHSATSSIDNRVKNHAFITAVLFWSTVSNCLFFFSFSWFNPDSIRVIRFLRNISQQP